jgi:hypothetical protein
MQKRSDWYYNGKVWVHSNGRYLTRPAGYQPQAASDKPQAASNKRQATSDKHLTNLNNVLYRMYESNRIR